MGGEAKAAGRSARKDTADAPQLDSQGVAMNPSGKGMRARDAVRPRPRGKHAAVLARIIAEATAMSPDELDQMMEQLLTPERPEDSEHTAQAGKQVRSGSKRPRPLSPRASATRADRDGERSRSLITRLIARKERFAALHTASQLERIEMIKAGVPSRLVEVLVDELDMPKERFCGMVGVSRATVDRKIKAGKSLDRSESESVLAMGRLIGQVEEMVRTSGDPNGFNPAHWVAEWLQEPLPALGGQRPGAFMDTDEGRALISGLVAQMQSGAYA